MGIKNLLKFLSNFEGIIQNKEVKDFSGKRIAIDISILIYQVVIAIRNSGSDLTNSNGEITSHILGLFNKTIYFLENGIIPIYVFDGKPNILKQKIIDLRKQIRSKALEKLNDENTTEEEKIKYFKRSVFISKEQILQCKELLDLMGIPYLEAKEEADSELAELCKRKIIYAVMTEDMDILTFGSPKIIRNLTTVKKIPLEISLDTVLEKIKLSYEEFIELCILFGCDYCTGLTDISTMEIYKSYLNTKSIDKTLEELKLKNYTVPEINYKNVKEYFLKKSDLEFKDEYNLRKPDNKKLINILIFKYGLIKNKVINKVRKLNHLYNIFTYSIST